MSRENFDFFLEEFNVGRDAVQYAEDTRYVVIQFIEIGGDHLDALMQYKPNATG